MLSCSRFRRIKEVIFLVALCFTAGLVAGGATFAQQTSSSPKSAPALEGQIRDTNGALIPGVKLQLLPEAPSSAGAASPSALATSDDTGSYLLTAAPGKYVLSAAKSGFQTLRIKDITLAAGVTRKMDLMLELPKDGDPIPVVAKPSPLPQFSDEPTFTVAGVTDTSNLGLHGSDANVRTSETLAKDAASLKPSGKDHVARTSGPGELHRFSGDEKEKSGDPVGAVHEYETAVHLDPSEENYFAWGAELLLHRAGQPAVEVFRKGAEAYPKSPRMHAGLGAAYYADGQYADAATQMCQASDLDPGDVQPYLFLGKMEKAAAEPLPCSEEKLARFANLQPANAWANYYYGLLLWKKARKAQDAGGFAAAEESLKKAASLDPSLGEVYVQLGLLYNARGRRDAALAAFQQAVSASPKLSAAHYQLSLAYRRAGDAAKAGQEMKIYDELRSSEDAQLATERRELRQFVTILKEGKSAP